MHHTQRFRVNSPKVIGEVMGGEAIIVDLETGAYFSLKGIGSELWLVLEKGASIGMIIDALNKRYPDLQDEILAAVESLIAELINEKLLVESKTVDADHRGPIVFSPGLDSETADFKAPVLEKFTEMADMLLLDPIHEVSAEGWPHKGARHHPS